MDISGDVARYSMEMAAARVSSAVQVSVLRNVMDLQQATMTQLLQSMGMGRALDLQALFGSGSERADWGQEGAALPLPPSAAQASSTSGLL